MEQVAGEDKGQVSSTESPQASAETKSSEPSGLRQKLQESLSSDAPAKESEVEPSTKQKPAKSIKAALKAKMNGDNAPAKTDEPAPTGIAQPTAATTQAAQSADPVIAPADMDASERAAFEALPDTAKAYLSRRAYQVRNYLTQAATQLANKEREISGVLEAIGPVRDEYTRQGMSVPQIVSNAIAWDRHFKANPIQAAKEYLSAWGVDPAELLDGQAGQQQAQPQQRMLTPEQVQEIVQSQIKTAQANAIHEQNTHQTLNVVKNFIGTKPLFKDPGTAAQLEQTMLPIISGLRQANPQAASEAILEEAYNYVTRGNPTFAGLVQKLEQKTVIDRTKAEAAKAEAASRSISGGPGSGTPTKTIKNLRENLRLRMAGAL